MGIFFRLPEIKRETYSSIDRFIEHFNELNRVIKLNLDAIETLFNRRIHKVESIVTLTDASNTLLKNYEVILCDTTANDVTINLPAAELLKGNFYHIKRITTDSNVVIIEPNGSELIESASSFNIPGGMLDSICIFSDGVQWWVL